MDIQMQDNVVKMHVKYCIGWSYKGSLVQIQQYVRSKIAEQRANYDMDDVNSIPKIEITGENYEVGGHKQLMSSIIGYLRTVFFILLFAGENFFTPFGGLNQMPSVVKDIYNTINENKIQFGFICFFLGTMVQNSLLQSGAFEIYVNGNLEFSKLQGGQMPTLHNVNDIFAKYNIHFWDSWAWILEMKSSGTQSLVSFKYLLLKSYSN